ncbi:G-protein coupled receptor dmsr-1-like [Planococcus citri]|uniref:G-protein coupled receptor dmsr-1-like n=1 Tax=Planococcus citri TaxID=170843 RepID=UPI0031F82D48
MSTKAPYCIVTLLKIAYYFEDNVYKYFNLPICFVGVISNLLNVLVFTRKTMISPPNLIFAHVALADFLVLLVRIPSIWPVYTRSADHDFNTTTVTETYAGAIFRNYNGIFISTFSFISIFLTVQLTAWRYVAVVYPLKERHWCNKKITRNVVIAGYITCCVLYAIPRHLSFDIFTVDKNQTITYQVSIRKHRTMYSMIMLTHALVFRLFPAIVVAGLTSRIIVTLLARTARHEQLTQSGSVQSDTRNVKVRQQMNRPTAMLLAVVALFFIAEFPKGILSLLSVIYEFGKPRTRCYKSLVKIFITITNINTSVTFIVYYALSEQFRIAFKSLFNCNIVSHQESNPDAAGSTEKITAGTKIDQV